MKRLREISEKRDLIGDIRGKGLMIGIELVKDRETKAPAAQEAARVRDLCREKFVLIGHGGVKGNVLRIQPPLVINREQLDHVIETVDQSLAEVSQRA